MEKVINKYGGLQRSGGIFYDIGSGTGKPALAAALLHDFDQVSIEILDGLYRISLEIQGPGRKIVPLLSDKKAQTKIKFTRGDATLIDWSDATCVFANSTCFDDALMKSLVKKADECKVGTFCIHLRESYHPKRGSFGARKSSYELGHATVFIHRKSS